MKETLEVLMKTLRKSPNWLWIIGTTCCQIIWTAFNL